MFEDAFSEKNRRARREYLHERDVQVPAEMLIDDTSVVFQNTVVSPVDVWTLFMAEGLKTLGGMDEPELVEPAAVEFLKMASVTVARNWIASQRMVQELFTGYIKTLSPEELDELYGLPSQGPVGHA